MTTAPHVRPLREEDLPEVADLWQRTFRRLPAPAPQGALDKFRELFLTGPMADPERPSLVRPGPNGRLLGFVGTFTIPFLFKGKRHFALVASTIMSDREAKGTAFVPFELLSALQAQPQDLLFSDGANHSIEPAFVRLGGLPIALYSLEWSLRLRPFGYYLAHLHDHPKVGRTARVLTPAATLVDGLFAKKRPRVPLLPKALQGKVSCTEASTAEYLQAMNLREASEVHPQHSLETLGWVLGQAASTLRFGPLRTRLVRQGDQILGGFCQFAKPKRRARVLDFSAASPLVAGAVLEQAILDAHAQGAASLDGQMDELFRRPLLDLGAHFTLTGYNFLAHSRHPEILHALMSGHTSFTRLHGEWWIPLGIDRMKNW